MNRSVTPIQADPTIRRLLDHNRHALAQILEVLEGVPATVYCQPFAPVDSSMGTHVRHVLEFYRLLVDGLQAPPVCYERRRRDPELETNPSRVRAEIEQLMAALDSLDSWPLHQPIAVNHCGASGAMSSLLRELQFLLDHATHHLAMVNIIGRQAGVPLPAALGIAQATLAQSAQRASKDDAQANRERPHDEAPAIKP